MPRKRTHPAGAAADFTTGLHMNVLPIGSRVRHFGSRAACLMAMSCVLWSCSEIVPATSHSPGEAAQVELYQSAPFKKYEKLGQITWDVTKLPNWSKDADATPAIEQLQASAAKLGANGILLVDEGQGNNMMVGAEFKGKHFLVPLRSDPPTVAVQAIFVHED